MGRTQKEPRDILDYVKELEQRVQNLERSQRIGNTAVDQGNVVVNNGAIVDKHPNGVELFRTGTGETTLPFDPSPTQGYVTRMRRANGQVVFEVFSSDDGGEAIVYINDRNGNRILSEDWLIGRGLDRPYIPWRSYPKTEWDTPPVVVTSATFVPTHIVEGNIQHPSLYVNARVAADIGTAGEIRLHDVIFGPLWTATISAGFNSNIERTGNISGLRNYGDNASFELQVRRTAGAGNIRVGIQQAYGRSATTL